MTDTAMLTVSRSSVNRNDGEARLTQEVTVEHTA